MDWGWSQGSGSRGIASFFPLSPAEQDQNLFTTSQGTSPSFTSSLPHHQHPCLDPFPPTRAWRMLTPGFVVGRNHPCLWHLNTNMTRQIKSLRNQPGHGRRAMTKVTPPQPGHGPLGCSSIDDHQGQEGLQGLLFLILTCFLFLARFFFSVSILKRPQFHSDGEP